MCSMSNRPAHTGKKGSPLDRRSSKSGNATQMSFGPRFGSEIIQPRLSEKNGIVYTKSWVVELILDLAGYTLEAGISNKLAVEPACGDGAFLLPMVDRLLASARRENVTPSALADGLIAFELQPDTATHTREALIDRLVQAHDVEPGTARNLANAWIRCGDYLLEAPFLRQADFVVGNPPYIRPEDVDPALLREYRRNFPSMVGRADIYVAFYEAALRALRPEGVCAFICADRWMTNHYGHALRALVTKSFSVEAVIEMHHADAFADEVSAYPAITIIRHSEQGAAVVSKLDAEHAAFGGKQLASEIRRSLDQGGMDGRSPVVPVARLEAWFDSNDPWPLTSPNRLKLLQRLETEFPPLEDLATETRVTIGVATGADPVFITKDAHAIESERLLPLAMARDTVTRSLEWSGHYLVNPWNHKGLVDLNDYPRMRAYFEEHADHLQKRHVAKKQPATWHRTIDRVHVDLAEIEKLYIPDIKERLLPVLDRGETYPHHNLYVIVSRCWDLEVLGGLLLSAVAQFFVECYAVRMRGGYLRLLAGR